MPRALPFLALTLGDPAGLGPWVAAAAARHPGVRRRARPVLVGDAVFLRQRLFRTALFHPLKKIEDYSATPGVVNVLNVPAPLGSLVLGRPQAAGGAAAVSALRAAASLAARRQVAAVVTAPVSKESLKMAGSPHPGHTELLAALTGARRVEMLMAAGPLRGLLLTRHLPLKDVSRRLSAKEIVAGVRLTDAFLRKKTAKPPRWVLCGLNPHAGDNGLLGHEEKRVVRPAAEALRRAGVRLEGPLPADNAWARHAAGDFDAVACLYHDQGMIPLKTLYPKAVVNVTVGLPWVRTSPGHGTAYDLAKDNYLRADPSATVAACLLALDLAEGK